MRTFLLLSMLLIALLSLPVAGVHAQAADVTGGTLTITLDPALRASLAAQGVTTTLGNSSNDGAVHMGVTSGSFDLGTGFGELRTRGALHFTASSGQAIHLQSLSLTTALLHPAVVADIYCNKVFMGRQVIFTVESTNPMDAPMKAGLAISGGLELVLSPLVANLIDSTFLTTALKNYAGLSQMQTRLTMSEMD